MRSKNVEEIEFILEKSEFGKLGTYFEWEPYVVSLFLLPRRQDRFPLCEEGENARGHCKEPQGRARSSNDPAYDWEKVIANISTLLIRSYSVSLLNRR
jgi:hypothetical protein